MTETSSTYQQSLAALKEALVKITNLEEEALTEDDHLLDDLMLQPASDIPRLFAYVSEELNIEIDQDQIVEFINVIDETPKRALVKEMAMIIKEELEYN